MATNMPNAVDTFTNPAGTDTQVGHAAQHDHINDAVLAIENVILSDLRFYVTGIDLTGVTPADTAINAAIAAATSAGLGTIVLPAGIIRVNAPLTTLGPKIGVLAPGSAACTIMYYGSGTCLRVRDPNFNIALDPVSRAGVLQGFTIDGTNASAGAEGLRYGDMNDAPWRDIRIAHFNGAGSIGMHFFNQNGWCEQNDIQKMRLVDNTNAVVFEQYALTISAVTVGATTSITTSVPHGLTNGTTVNLAILRAAFTGTGAAAATTALNVTDSAALVTGASTLTFHANTGTTATYTASSATAYFGYNSFDYSNYNFWIEANADQNGVVMKNNINMFGAMLSVRGNFQTKASANAGVVLTVGVGNNDNVLFQGILDVMVEANGALANGHTTISMGGNFSLCRVSATGVLVFKTADGSFTTSTGLFTTGSANFAFSGICEGDANISGITPAGALVFGQAFVVDGGMVTTQGFITNTTGACPIFLGGGNTFSTVLAAGAHAFSFDSPSIGRANEINLFLTQPASGTATATWPAGNGTSTALVKWAAGTAPTLTATVNKTDWIKLVTNNGIMWYGVVVAANMS